MRGKLAEEIRSPSIQFMVDQETADFPQLHHFPQILQKKSKKEIEEKILLVSQSLSSNKCLAVAFLGRVIISPTEPVKRATVFVCMFRSQDNFRTKNKKKLCNGGILSLVLNIYLQHF